MSTLFMWGEVYRLSLCVHYILHYIKRGLNEGGEIFADVCSSVSAVLFVCLLLLRFLPLTNQFVYLTAARPGYSAWSALSYDWKQSEDVPQTNKASWEAVSPNDTGWCSYLHKRKHNIFAFKCFQMTALCIVIAICWFLISKISYMMIQCCSKVQNVLSWLWTLSSWAVCRGWSS